MIDFEKLCTEVQRCVIDTAVMIRKERENFSLEQDVETKGPSDFVTRIDKLSEEMLVKELSLLLPEAGFIAEEGTSSKVGEVYNWIIDPIDGTTNFIHGLSPHAISVALQRNNEMVIGVVYEIVHQEMFCAWEGSAAFLNGQRISVSQCERHEQALISTGFPYRDFSQLDAYFATMKKFMEISSGVRRFGSAAIDLCYVACGRFDAFWEYGLKSYDMAAGAFILERAGGKVSDFNGENQYLENGNIVAASGLYFSNFYEIVHHHLGN
ncbi:inositol monophosphatase family protein [Roseimarinus sediminis]|uniref:inositol monophosphatase family protein n=1 Tax=Roseimarinus sediminis TaxID=1610899 RepID=UPI003D262646